VIEVTTYQEIEDFLKHQLVGRIGCHADGITYIVPVSYAYDGEYVYCHGKEGMKMYMMRKNPNLCFEVDNYQSLDNWKSVIAWGVFEELKGGPEKAICIERLRNRILPMITSQTMRFSEDWPFSESNEVPGSFFRIKLVEKTGRQEKAEVKVYFGG